MERNILIISHVCSIYVLLNNEYHYQSAVNQTLHTTAVAKKIFVIRCPNLTMYNFITLNDHFSLCE